MPVLEPNFDSEPNEPSMDKNWKSIPLLVRYKALEIARSVSNENRRNFAKYLYLHGKINEGF